MEVYVELALIENLALDYIILYIACNIAGQRPSKARLFAASFVGAVFALICPLISLNGWYINLARVAFGTLLIPICIKVNGYKKYIKCVAALYATAFATGGFLYALLNLANLRLLYNGRYELGSIPAALLLTCAVFLLLIGDYVVIKVKKKKTVQKFTYACKLKLSNKTVDARGYLDSGNTLTYCGRAVCLISAKLAEAIGLNEALGEVAVTTVNAVSRLSLYKIDELLIYFSIEANINNDVAVAIAVKGFSDEYDILLNPLMDCFSCEV